MIGLALALAFATTPQPLQQVKAPLRPCPSPPLMLMKTADAAKARFQRLGDLPDAHMEIAVNRLQGGCPAPMIVRYDVSADNGSSPWVGAGVDRH